jgi:hypothetical protein
VTRRLACTSTTVAAWSARTAANRTCINIHLLISVVTGKPKYNQDGTVKKPAKSGTEEVKFSFR